MLIELWYGVDGKFQSINVFCPSILHIIVALDFSGFIDVA